MSKAASETKVYSVTYPPSPALLTLSLPPSLLTLSLPSPLLIIPSFDHSLIANNSLRVFEAGAAMSGSLNICGELQMQ